MDNRPVQLPVTCTDSSCPETPRAPPNTTPSLNTTTSTDYNTTAMAPIDDAIKDLKLRDLGEHFTLREVAEKYQVNVTNKHSRGRLEKGCAVEGQPSHKGSKGQQAKRGALGSRD